MDSLDEIFYHGSVNSALTLDNIDFGRRSDRFCSKGLAVTNVKYWQDSVWRNMPIIYHINATGNVLDLREPEKAEEIAELELEYGLDLGKAIDYFVQKESIDIVHVNDKVSIITNAECINGMIVFRNPTANKN